MNTLFNTALKQSTSLKRDLSLSSNSSPTTTSPAQQPTPSLLGQISASLTAFSRTLDQYTLLAKSELNASKKDKALDRLSAFRSDLSTFRAQFTDLKALAEENQAHSNRAELLGRRPHQAATPDNPYSHAPAAASIWAPSGSSANASGLGMNSGEASREKHALREQSFFADTHSALDEYLARGQAVLGDLGQQREILKGTQRRLYSVASTLGVSGDTIKMIERRARQDKWIFYMGVVVFLLFCWGVVHFLT